MKTNKKAILGMLVAMVMSMGVLQGVAKQQSDSNLQQVAAIVCGVGATETGDGWMAAAGIMSAACLTFATGGAAVMCL